MSALGPFRTAPVFKTKARWGDGSRLGALGLAPPAHMQPVGEVWLVTDLPGAVSEILDGPFAGQSLRQAIAARPAALLGPAAAAEDAPRFPLLVKILDTREWLSVQVHPDGATAQVLGHGQRGKHEAWLILAVGERAEVMLGVDAGGRAGKLTLEQLLADGEALLAASHRHTDLQAGDAFEITPGTIHTARDLMALEVQEPSDLTYRIYDWGRDPEERPLHSDSARICIQRAAHGSAPPPVSRRGPARLNVAPTAPFQFESLRLKPGERLELSEAGIGVIVGLEHGVTLEPLNGGPSLALDPGQAAVVPFCCRGVRLIAGPHGCHVGRALAPTAG